MASLGTWPAAPARRTDGAANPGRWLALTGTVTLALVPLVVGTAAANAGFISNIHAHLIEKALLAVDRGRLELIGFVYPPIPFLLVLPRPLLHTPTVIAALCSGATWWLLWRHVGRVRMPFVVRLGVLLACMAVPSMLYVATSSVGEALAILLVVASWRHCRRFYLEGSTQSGFLAGLTFGLVFFVNHYALAFALAFTALAPLLTPKRRHAAHVASGFVIVFPVVTAALIWAYINWVFTGDPLRFLRDPGSALFVYARAGDGTNPVGWPLALESVAMDMVVVPLYLLVAWVVSVRDPRRLVVFLVPPLVVAASRAVGMVYLDYFAVATFTVIGLLALPRAMPRLAWPGVLLAALFQLVAGAALRPGGEAELWWSAVVTGHVGERAVEERAMAEYLAQLPDRSVLLDDRVGFRIVARAGTARPFLLPADSLYPLAESRPQGFVEHVLVPTAAAPAVGGRVASVLVDAPPEGFAVDATWHRWWLYTAARSETAAGN